MQINSQQFENLIKQKAQEVKKYAELEFPTEAGNTALRFIDGNFRAQGWQGQTFQGWKANKRKGRILVHKGHLRNASYYTTAPGVATIKNTRPYAKIHNEGGSINKTVTVHSFIKKAHSRKKATGRGSIRVKSHAVKSHSRKMVRNVEQRQFAPTASSPSPVLNNAVERGVVRKFKQIFQ